MIETSKEVFDSSTTVVKIKDNEVVVSVGELLTKGQVRLLKRVMSGDQDKRDKSRRT